MYQVETAKNQELVVPLIASGLISDDEGEEEECANSICVMDIESNLSEEEEHAEELAGATFTYAGLLLLLLPLHLYFCPPFYSITAITSLFIVFNLSLVNSFLASWCILRGKPVYSWLMWSYRLNACVWFFITCADVYLWVWMMSVNATETKADVDVTHLRVLSVLATVGGLVHCGVWFYAMYTIRRLAGEEKDR
mmetsp:Transcript_15389/g.22729  ORF Transcript_15389/g.22729 Transcript_15389/m.22729 type:complete len:195 (-) Transcript_15389:1061-1645(-)